jgi:hypothetical protein
MNTSKFDFALLHNECDHYIGISEDIKKKFNDVHSYKKVINDYVNIIQTYQRDYY